MRKELGLGFALVILSSLFTFSAVADELVAELEMADGLNCPCKTEVVVPPPPPPPPPSSPAKYYGEAEVFGLSKRLLDGGDNVTSKGSVLAGPFDTGSTIRDIGDATEEYRFGGGRLTIGRVLNDRDSAELTLMGFSHDYGSSITDPGFSDINIGFLQPPGFIQVPLGLEFAEVASQSLDYDTQLISGELNYRRQLSRILSTLAGVRYAYFADDLHFVSVDTTDGTGIHNIDAENHLIGFQIGSDIDIPLTNRLSANGGVKLGGFLNVASIDSHIFDDDGNSVRFDDTDVRGSAITEGKVGMSWHFTPNVSVSLGYMAMLLSWVTTSGEQFPQANSAQEFQKHDTDHVLVHGPLARINIILP